MLDNKALPTTNKPVIIFLILLKRNAFPIWYLMWKERKTSFGKRADSNSLLRILLLMPLEPFLAAVFCNFV